MGWTPDETSGTGAERAKKNEVLISAQMRDADSLPWEGAWADALAASRSARKREPAEPNAPAAQVRDSIPLEELKAGLEQGDDSRIAKFL